jgi:acyl-CoA synthetase (AMP-forming)/AMP-acid ligase II
MNQSTLPPLPAPSIIHRLVQHAETQPRKAAYHLIDKNLEIVQTYDYGELHRRTLLGCRRFRMLAERGDRILIFFEPGIRPLIPFYAALMGGFIAVPAPPPPGLGTDTTEALSADARVRREALQNLLLDCTPSVIVTSLATVERIEAMTAALNPRPRILPLESFDTYPETVGDDLDVPLPAADEIAMLQYTSGSTSVPKGVVLTHGNLVYNQLGNTAFLNTSADTITVSWLPMFHDMGLIGDAIQTVWVGATCIKLTPQDFLRRPSLWMEAVDRFRATLTGGPNFAFSFASSAVGRTRRTLDLSSLTRIYCGSEPIRESVLEGFIQAYAPHGLAPETVTPCYGLAENSLVVSGLKRGRFRSTKAPGAERPGPDPAPVVSCGSLVWTDAQLEILDPQTGQPAPNGAVGEIVVTCRSASPGYWQALGARPARYPDLPRVLRTGDLGFLIDGELYVHGRLKNTLILHGRKLVAEDVEAFLDRTVGGEADRFRSAVFQLPASGHDAIIVLAEGRFSDATEEIIERILTICAEAFGFRPAACALIRPGTIPRTTSGKLQRQQAARRWLEGGFVSKAASEATTQTAQG